MDTRRILGIATPKYEIIQNYSAFAIMQLLAERHRATFKYAGVIDGGRVVVLQCKIGQSFEVRPGDVHEKFLTCVNSFDSSRSLRLGKRDGGNLVT